MHLPAIRKIFSCVHSFIESPSRLVSYPGDQILVYLDGVGLVCVRVVVIKKLEISVTPIFLLNNVCTTQYEQKCYDLINPFNITYYTISLLCKMIMLPVIAFYLE